MAIGIGLVGKGEVRHIRDLTDEEYERVKLARKALGTFADYEDLYAILNQDFDAYHTLLNHVRETYAQLSVQWPEMQAAMGQIRRRLLHLLSSWRTYIDHNDRAFKQRYGEASPEFQRFDQACGHEFETSFSYRLIDFLRNYGQHRLMPIHNLHLHAKRVSDNPDDVVRVIAVMCDRDRLLEDRKMKPKLRPEVGALPALFDLTPHIHAARDSLGRISLVVANNEIPKLIEPAAFLYRLVKPVSDGEREPVLLEIDLSAPGDFQMRWEHLPLRLIENIVNIAYKQKKMDRDGNLL